MLRFAFKDLVFKAVSLAVASLQDRRMADEWVEIERFAAAQQSLAREEDAARRRLEISLGGSSSVASSPLRRIPDDFRPLWSNRRIQLSERETRIVYRWYRLLRKYLGIRKHQYIFYAVSVALRDYHSLEARRRVSRIYPAD